MKNFALFLVLVMLMATSSHVSAMEAARDEIGKDKSGEKDSDRTAENSTRTRARAAKDQAEMGSGGEFADDDDSACEASSPSTTNPFAASDEINIDENYLAQQIELAQKTVGKLKVEKERFENSSLSPASRSPIKSAAERDYAAWQETSRRYGIFLEEAGEGTIFDETRDQVLNLISASHETSKAAQEILNLVSQKETVRLPGSSTNHEPSTTNPFTDSFYGTAVTEGLQRLTLHAFH